MFLVPFLLQFFLPLTPINVNIIYERAGRPSGEANVEFETYEDASQAMSKVNSSAGCTLLPRALNFGV